MAINFDTLYKKGILKGKEISKKPPAIRASSMPFCPIEFVLKYIEYLSDESTWEYTGDFYCDQGTAVHEAVQKWLPMVDGSSGVLMGNWKCNPCGGIAKTRSGKSYFKPFMVYNLVGPIDCPRCDRPMMYEEFELNVVDAPITGHCDGLLLDREYMYEKIKKYYSIDMAKSGEGVWVMNKLIHDKKMRKKIVIPALVLELKTTSSFNVRQLKAPAHKYHCQASFYASALQKILKKNFKIHTIDVGGYVLKYIARDNPHLTSKDFIQERNNKIYKTTIKLTNLFFESFITGKYKKLYKTNPCGNYPAIYKDCDFQSFCNDELNFKDFKVFCKEVKSKFKKIDEVQFSFLG